MKIEFKEKYILIIVDTVKFMFLSLLYVNTLLINMFALCNSTFMLCSV